jgi:2'-deoxynucleoside 5'-phosphate N-hydrolase
VSRVFSRNVYISGPLQAASDLAAARDTYEAAAEVCRQAGWDAYVPHQATDPIANADVSSGTVFARDLSRVSQADAILAFIGPPSSGVGAELGIAFAAEKIVIGVYFESERPSRFILGMLQSMPSARVIEATCWSEAKQEILQHLRSAEQRLSCEPLNAG